VPNSYLWLMEPGDSGGSESTKAALLRSVAAEGVAAQRVLFAPRAAKARHIHRHAAADLFLDTIVYGAHSTATDALRGVRPRGNLIVSCVAVYICALSCAGPAGAYITRRGVSEPGSGFVICVLHA
jgi:hypothetical protein